MIVDELVARLGFRSSGENEARKFIRQLDEARKGMKRLQTEARGAKFDVRANVSGLTRVTRELDRSTAAARRFRIEAERASRTRISPRITPGGVGPKPHPGRVSEGARPAKEAGGGGSGLVDTALTVAATVSGYKAVKKYAELETAATEFGKTVEKPKEDVLRDTESYSVDGPKIGFSQKQLIEGAQAFAAAGIEYDTALKASMTTARAAKAAAVDFDDAAAAGVVALQNLKINVSDLGKTYDIAIKGGKLGKAEFKELAGSFPELAASAGKSGITGTKGMRDIIAATEVVREGTSTTGEATTNMKDLLEKIIAPDVAKHFKKHAGINLEKELLAREKKGSTRLDAFLDILGKHTQGGNEFRVSEYLHEQQSRAAAVALLRGRDKYEGYKKEIDTGAAGTTETDLAKTLDTTQGSFDRLSASADRAETAIGELGTGTARALADITTAALQAAKDGKGSTQPETDAMVGKLNKLLGEPPTYKRLLGEYGKTTSSDEFGARYGTSMKSPSFGSVTDRMDWKRSAGEGAKGAPYTTGGKSPSVAPSMGMTPPKFGGIGDRADWMRQGTQQAVTNTTNNTNVGNDQRTQTANVTVNATGLEQVAASLLASVKSGLSSLGPSIAKGNTTPTAPTLTGP